MRPRPIIALALLLVPALPWRACGHEDLLALIARLSAQIATNQNDASVLIQRANVYRLHQDWDEARRDYAAAAKLAPDSALLLIGQAQLYADRGEDAAARAAFDAVLTRQPTNTVALFGRARILTRLGDRNAAIADYDRGLGAAANPQPDQYLERAALVATEFGPDKALQGLDEGLSRLGWAISFQQAAIELELKRGQTQAALTRLETNISKSNRNERWLAWKGEILLAAGKPEAAREVLSTALKSIDGLPPRMRNSPAMTDLRTKVTAMLTSTPANGADAAKVPARP